MSGDRGVFAEASLGPSRASGSRGGGVGVSQASEPSRATVGHASTALGDGGPAGVQVCRYSRAASCVMVSQQRKVFKLFFSVGCLLLLPQKKNLTDSSKKRRTYVEKREVLGVGACPRCLLTGQATRACELPRLPISSRGACVATALLVAAVVGAQWGESQAGRGRVIRKRRKKAFSAANFEFLDEFLCIPRGYV